MAPGWRRHHQPFLDGLLTWAPGQGEHIYGSDSAFIALGPRLPFCVDNLLHLVNFLDKFLRPLKQDELFCSKIFLGEIRGIRK
jgi:hypothetical protein